MLSKLRGSKIMSMGTLYNKDDKRIDKIMLPSRVLEAVEYIAARNGRSRLMEIRKMVTTNEEVQRVLALKDELGEFPDIED